MLEEPQSESIGEILNSLGIAFANSKPQEAFEFYMKALSIAELRFGQNSSLVGDVYNNIGALHYRLSNYSEAEKYMI